MGDRRSGSRGPGAAVPPLATGLLLLLLLHSAPAADPDPAGRRTFDIRVPKDADVPQEEDGYVCTTLALPAEAMKLVGVAPLAEQSVVHHILLFGCSVPHIVPKSADDQPVWDCKRAPTCGSAEETILYGWGRNAPKLDLPEGVGFSVGGTSSIRYIVAQVHYLQPKPKADNSGVSLTLQSQPVPYSAGMLSFASWFTIPPRAASHPVVNSCCYRGFQPLKSFAVRVHTHSLGRAVTMVRPRGVGNGTDVLAHGDPQAPQGFNPVTPSAIHPGDPLTVTCLFNSSAVDHPVSAGPSHDHEMCNMYLMVYSAIPHIEMCSDGEGLVADTQPGNLPRAAGARPDPSPGWRPPGPAEAPEGGKGVLGDVASVALGPDGALWALHRGGAVWDNDSFGPDERLRDPKAIESDVIVQMDPDTGKVLRRFGGGHFYMPHMLTLDRDGNVWATDVGRHQVLKFSPEGKLLLELGKKLQPGGGADGFCKPTQVAFLRDGSFLVSDGYCNARVARFSASGAFQSDYSLASARAAAAASSAAGGAEAPAALKGPEVAVPHGVLVDECARTLHLADREGKRVLTFDLDTHALLRATDLSSYGRVWALRAGPYGRVLALTWELGADASLVEVTGFDATYAPSWKLPGTAALWPHDFALGAAPLALSGARDRLFAVWLAPLCVGCGPVRKFVLFPNSLADAVPSVAAAPAPAPRKPVLAHLGGHSGDAAAAAALAAAAAAPAAAAAAAPAPAAAAAPAAADEELAGDEKDGEEEGDYDVYDEMDEQEEEEVEKALEEAEAAVEEEEEAEEEADFQEGMLAAEQQLKGGAGPGGGVEHETLRMRPAEDAAAGGGGGGGGGFWLVAAQVAVAGAVLAAIVAAGAYALARRNDARGALPIDSELAKLARGGGGGGGGGARHPHGAHGPSRPGGRAPQNGAHAARGGAPRANGHARGDAEELVFGVGGGEEGEGDDDLERLEREVLLRSGRGRSGPALGHHR
ncbi:peptidyl-glycine alpha-amidating monooxygenase A precursor [Raphidocelis subcapitata]|uniref:Peptidyl-glycine alpha-amidating monooxygenase A n=1 Tax=Raphidocelis subcapitata TaxID=307507 RepID=A0A2V0PD51_9CHLO|nr:peptidyl-glycine alpha-amidating monooxygenase A precursor [Raphidocelis subcapitata]|eukprot:GBF95833.1 peptidyl-glycine alpha-amidating monooxygenase A precursor [Raphidocelis subcapitata]